MHKKPFRKTLEEVIFAKEGSSVWLNATNQIKDRLDDSFTKEELQVMADSLAAAEERWEASRLKTSKLITVPKRTKQTAPPTKSMSLQEKVILFLVATNLAFLYMLNT